MHFTIVFDDLSLTAFVGNDQSLYWKANSVAKALQWSNFTNFKKKHSIKMDTNVVITHFTLIDLFKKRSERLHTICALLSQYNFFVKEDGMKGKNPKLFACEKEEPGAISFSVWLHNFTKLQPSHSIDLPSLFTCTPPNVPSTTENVIIQCPSCVNTSLPPRSPTNNGLKYTPSDEPEPSALQQLEFSHSAESSTCAPPGYISASCQDTPTLPMHIPTVSMHTATSPMDIPPTSPMYIPTAYPNAFQPYVSPNDPFLPRKNNPVLVNKSKCREMELPLSSLTTHESRETNLQRIESEPCESSLSTLTTDESLGPSPQSVMSEPGDWPLSSLATNESLGPSPINESTPPMNEPTKKTENVYNGVCVWWESLPPSKILMYHKNTLKTYVPEK